MPSKWQYPRVGSSWSECSFCGQDFPSSQVWLNPRYGWQCYKCWDGLIQRDQILQPIFPYEGTRRTPAPTTQTLTQGIDGPVDVPFQWYFLDRVTGDIYLVTLPPFTIGAAGNLIYFTTSVASLELVTDTDDNPVFTGLRVFNGWDLYVANGAVATEMQQPQFPGIAEGICDFGEISNNCVIYLGDLTTGLVYLVDFSARPPTASLADDQSVTPVFDAAQIPNGYYAIVNGGLVATTTLDSEWVLYTNTCLDDVPVGGEEGIPTGEFTVDCPDSVVTNLDVDFTANPPVVPVSNYHWDFGDGYSSDTGTTATVSHRYDYPGGTFDVVLTVTATDGRTSSSEGCPVTATPVTFSIDERWERALPVLPTMDVDERWERGLPDLPTEDIDERWES